MTGDVTLTLTAEEHAALSAAYADANFAPAALRGLTAKLAAAQPVQPSALERLEEWAEQQTTGYVRIRSVWLESAEPSALLSISISPGWEVHLVPSSDEVGDVVLHRATLDLAINAALDAVEGGE